MLSPLIFPALVTGLALMQLLSAMGSGDARINLLIGHIVVTSPYVIRAVVTSLLLVDYNLEDAARTLGANRLRTFWRITLPQIAPGVAAGALFAFMVSFDNYPVTMWLANSEYSPVPLVLMRQLVNVFDPSVPAMSTVIIILAVVGVLDPRASRRPAAGCGDVVGITTEATTEGLMTCRSIVGQRSRLQPERRSSRPSSRGRGRRRSSSMSASTTRPWARSSRRT